MREDGLKDRKVHENKEETEERKSGSNKMEDREKLQLISVDFPLISENGWQVFHGEGRSKLRASENRSSEFSFDEGMSNHLLTSQCQPKRPQND